MAKRRNISVSWHEASSQFVKWIGKARGKDGKIKPKCFYLGSDETIAITKAASLRDEWNTLKSQGIEAWPEQSTDAKPSNPPSPTPALLTIKDAAKDYLSLVKAEANAQQVTQEHYEAARYRVARVISFLGAERTLVSIGEREVKQFVQTVAARPEVAAWRGEMHKISLSYARKIISEGKADSPISVLLPKLRKRPSSPPSHSS